MKQPQNVRKLLALSLENQANQALYTKFISSLEALLLKLGIGSDQASQQAVEAFF